LELARAGCRVVIDGRNPEVLDKTAAEIRAETGGAELIDGRWRLSGVL
jgi:NAD(P)-dependent dehydrogenase (short-subunit alcohol dehydrogenase family)